MIHFCMFGGHKGRINSGEMIYVTIFGGCELKQPTLAKRINEMRRRQSAGLPVRRRNFFINIFGGASITHPTLAEEYLDLQDALRAGAFTLDEWDVEVARLGSESVSSGSFSFCGGFDSDSLPSEKDEIEGLALNRHLGHITTDAGRTLEFGVGQRGAQRTAVLRQAVSSATAALA